MTNETEDKVQDAAYQAIYDALDEVDELEGGCGGHADGAAGIALSALSEAGLEIHPKEEVLPRYTHTKSGVHYEIVGDGIQENDNELCTIYRRVGDTTLWVRPKLQFHSKFVRVHLIPEGTKT